MKGVLVACSILLLLGVAPQSFGGVVDINLFDWAFYVDGTTYEFFAGDSMPTNGTLTNGLGSLSWSTSAPGSHTFIAFFDHEIDEAINSYVNEYGGTVGTPASGQSWEIDVPGFSSGDIYFNVLAGRLDNSNGVPSSAPDDVSMALGWDFDLNPGQNATISLLLAGQAPSSGFYLTQTDPDTPFTLYFSSALEVREVPEPGTLLLLVTGVTGLAAFRRRLRK